MRHRHWLFHRSLQANLPSLELSSFLHIRCHSWCHGAPHKQAGHPSDQLVSCVVPLSSLLPQHQSIPKPWRACPQTAFSSDCCCLQCHYCIRSSPVLPRITVLSSNWSPFLQAQFLNIYYVSDRVVFVKQVWWSHSLSMPSCHPLRPAPTPTARNTCRIKSKFPSACKSLTFGFCLLCVITSFNSQIYPAVEPC